MVTAPRRWLDPRSDASEATRELLRAARGPSPGARGRVWRSLEASTAQSPATSLAGAAARTSLRFFAAKVGLASVCVALAGRALLGGAGAPPREAPRAAMVTAARPLRTTAAPSPAPRPAPARVAPTTETAPTPQPSRPSARRPLGAPRALVASAESAPPSPAARARSLTGAALARPPEPPTPEPTFEAEMNLANAALGARETPARFLQLADEYRQRHPRGQFVQELEAYSVAALARLGRADEARRRGEAFLRAHPTSTVAALVRESLRTIP